MLAKLLQRVLSQSVQCPQHLPLPNYATSFEGPSWIVGLSGLLQAVLRDNDQFLVQADRLGSAPTFDASAKIGDLHTEALSLQVYCPATLPHASVGRATASAGFAVFAVS